MIKWQIQSRIFVQWTVWDVFVELEDGRVIELVHGQREKLGVQNCIDRFMDFITMHKYFNYVSYDPGLEIVYKAMSND